MLTPVVRADSENRVARTGVWITGGSIDRPNGLSISICLARSRGKEDGPQAPRAYGYRVGAA